MSTVAEFSNANTELIILCSVVGGEFRHLRPRARVVGSRAHLEPYRGTEDCRADYSATSPRGNTGSSRGACSDDDGTIAARNGKTESIMHDCSVVGGELSPLATTSSSLAGSTKPHLLEKDSRTEPEMQNLYRPSS